MRLGWVFFCSVTVVGRIVNFDFRKYPDAHGTILRRAPLELLHVSQSRHGDNPLREADDS
jgi:hypothetical protein